MDQNETLGWMGVAFGALLAFVVVAKLTIGVVSTGPGPATPEAALYVVIAIGCYALGSGLVVRAQSDGSGALSKYT